ncbi:uncharacterized protein Hap1MRO34_016269 isoform 2-T2 [Clarias gariepinus]|uniref:trichohyalin isoform X2 n=1 Tax=Clarias gariepinus TaxID=13013 RepID=UPI00234DD16E|nr:trichohyalin isoform X2 [Clarias gariepinus]
MEGSESAINRFGRAIWTVWGYLRGTVGRYLRPEVTNEEAHNLHFKQEDSEAISKSSIELKEKEEGKERTETKLNETRDDLLCPGVRVRAAAVQWESIAHGGHEVKDKSKHICHSSEEKNKKSQTKSDNEQIFENQEKFSAYTDAGIKNRDSTLSGSEEGDLNAERREQEQTKKLEKKEEEKTMMIENDDTEKEHLKCKFVNQNLSTKEANLSVERSEKNQEQEKASEKHVEVEDVDELMRQENDETQKEQSQEKTRKQKEEDVDIMRKDKDKHEKELLKNESINQGLLTNEIDITVERNENSQEQKRKQEEEDKLVDEIIKRENEVPEKDPTKSQFVEQALLTKEAALNVERGKSSQEQRTKHEEAENSDKIITRLIETGNEILTRDNNQNDEEPIKCEFNDQGFLTNEADLNVETEGSQDIKSLLAVEADLNVENIENQEQIRKLEKEERSHEQISRREYERSEEEPINSEFIKQGLLAEKGDLYAGRNENQEQRRKFVEESIEEISRREYDEGEEEHIKSEFITQGSLAEEADLNAERNEILEQRRKLEEEEEGLEEISRKEYDEGEEEPIKSEFITQGSLAEEADLNAESNENQEQTRKLEEEEERIEEISRRECDEGEEEPSKSELIGSKKQRRKLEKEEEGLEEISRKEYDEGEEEPIKSVFITQGSLAEEADLNAERNEILEQRRKLEKEEEELEEISRKEYDEGEEEPIKSKFITQGSLAKEADLNAESNENQEQTRKLEEEEERIEEISREEYDEGEEEFIKMEFIKHGSLAEEADLNIERNEILEQRRKLEKDEEGLEEISRREYDEVKEEPIKSELVTPGLLAEKPDLDLERNENQEQIRKLEEDEQCIEDISMKEYDEGEEEPIKSDFITQGSLAEEADLNAERNEILEQRRKLEKEEEGLEEISRKEYDEGEEEPIKSEFITQGSLAEEADLNAEMNEILEQRRKLEKEEKGLEEISRREYDEGKEEPIKSELVTPGLLAEEPDLNLERNENQEQRRKLEEDEQCIEDISRKEYDGDEEEPIKSEFITQGSLAEEADLNAERNEILEQRRKLEKEEKGLEEISKKEYDEGKEEPIKSVFITQGLLAEEADLNSESNENQEQTRKLEEEEERIEEISRREYDEGEEEPIKSDFITQGSLAEEADLNAERDEILEQRRKLEKEKEGLEEISRKEYDEGEEEPIKSEFITQGSLAEEADLNAERNEILEQRRKLEKEEKGLEEISRREYDEGKEEPIKSELVTPGLLAEEPDLNLERNENQEQIRKLEEDEQCIEDISRKEYDGGEEEPINSEFITQGSLAEEDDLNAERNEILEQRRKLEKEEEGLKEISRKEYDEGEEEPIKSEFITQGSLAEEADLNAESNENQEQTRKLEEEEERIEEISRREYDEGEEEPIKSEFIKQGSLAEEADLNAESNENQEQRRKLEEESTEQISRREYDKGEEEPIKSEFIKQGSLAEEADLNAESNENQEQRRKLDQESIEQISRREYDKGKEEPIKSEFIKQVSLAEEADLNAKSNENQEQTRKLEEEEESIEEISRREYDEGEEEPIKSEFFKQGSLAEEADVNAERNENQEQRKKHEEDEQCIEKISMKEYDEGEEEPIKSGFIKQGLLAEEGDLNAKRNENQEQRSKKEKESIEEISIKKYNEHDKEPIKSDFTDQSFDPEEQAGVCEMENKAVAPLVSVKNITECVYDQDINELNVRTEHEYEVSKSQMVDEGMFIQLDSTQELRSLLNDTSVLHEKEVIEGHNEETNQETVEKENDGHREEFSGCEHVTDTGIVEEQKVCGTELKQFDVVDRIVVIESDLLEMAQIETAKMSEASNAQKADSEMVLNIDLEELDDKACDQNSSEIQQPAIVTEENIEGVITRPETGTGNQTETVKTTPKFRAEAAAMDVKKSTEKDTSSYKQPIEREEVAVQEKTGQCFLEQWSLLEEPNDTRINELRLCEAPLSEVKSVSLERVDKPAVESIYEMQSSSFQEECSSETAFKIKAISSSPGQTPEDFETRSEETLMSRGEHTYEQAQPNCSFSLVEKTIFGDNPVEDKINQDKYKVLSLKREIGYSEGLCLPERESEQETLEMPKNLLKDTEEQELIDKAEPGLLVEIKDVTPRFGVMKGIISDLTKKLDKRRNDHESEVENLKEMSGSNLNVEILSDTKECKIDFVAEMTDIESIGSISTIGEMESGEKTQEPITKEEKDKCQLVFSETTASKEISKELKKEIKHGESVMDSKEYKEERDRSGQKRGFENVAGDKDKDKPSGLTDLLFLSEASSLDFTVQKSKIAVKNPLVRPPKDPRMLINMPSVEPLTPPQPTQPSFLKKSPLGGASIPKGVIGFKLPGLGAGFPALRKTEAGKKIRDGEDTESATSQKSDSSSQSADDNVKQETLPPKPKWTPPRQPGMGSPMMMAELKSKLRKPAKE